MVLNAFSQRAVRPTFFGSAVRKLAIAPGRGQRQEQLPDLASGRSLRVEDDGHEMVDRRHQFVTTSPSHFIHERRSALVVGLLSS